ncbi:MAG: hypothetical protein M1420_01730 [Actinobacteria bacterium]|jgi:hypothetical protein|nr:hypothetical protein [Actinomycetota bacterium]
MTQMTQATDLPADRNLTAPDAARKARNAADAYLSWTLPVTARSAANGSP